jgi:hypothetical protein
MAMARFYKIHPAIGVARIGNSPDAFFVGPESPGSRGVELAAGGAEPPVERYKADGQVKRQAARFRVYEYERDGAGQTVLLGEVTADVAAIEWKVDLVNRKAALDRSAGPAEPRNLSVTDRASLIIRDPRDRKISGRDQAAVAFDQGRFQGQPVYLGELRTDGAGRLLVLGGRGHSASVPPGLEITEYMNNDGWHDDVADGPVTATLMFPGQPARPVDASAWVVVGPPDYAPGVGGIVTLYDVARQAAIERGFLQPPARPSFERDIRPRIQAASDLRWVHTWGSWNAVSRDWAALADPGPASAQLRAAVSGLLVDPPLSNFRVPPFLKRLLDQWKDGDFDSDLAPAAAPKVTPDGLDRAALTACIGANFWPGIEAGVNLRDAAMYSEAFRLDPANTEKVFPGCLTEIMALPWQADFYDCRSRWWPSQRPDIAMLDPARIPQSQVSWAKPIGDYMEMLESFGRLGFIVPRTVNGASVFVEDERDPAFPR